jgi:hypothetical protein
VDEPRPGGLIRSFRTYLDIVLFRQGPEDLPVSQSILFVTIAANILLGLASDALLPLPEFNRIGVAGVESVFTVAWYWALLQVARRPERFVQTTSAVFGVFIVMLPLYTAAKWLTIGHEPKDLPPLVMFVGLVVQIWLLAVNARILQSATQWPLAACIGVTLLREVVLLMVVAAAFPEALRALEQTTGATTT